MKAQKLYSLNEDAEIWEIPVGQLLPNEANPNQMSDKQFDLLTESLEETGQVDLLQVVPLPGDQWRIVGGAHRWRSAKVLGWPTVVAMVLVGEKWEDTDFQNAMMVRLNVLHGEMSPERFFNLWRDLVNRHKEEMVQKMLGFARKENLEKLIGQYTKRMKKAGVSKKKTKEFEEASKEAKSVEDLSAILHKIFRESGDDLKQNFMVFSAKGGNYLYVLCDDKLWKTVKEMMDKVVDREVDAVDVFKELMRDWNKLEIFKEERDEPGDDQEEDVGGVS